MVFTVLGALAELERSLIAERVRAGLHSSGIPGVPKKKCFWEASNEVALVRQ
jgi:DNA invertase Pin-like site-specific DNA recombinase